MSLGGERSRLIANPVKRAGIRLIGDTHFGRVVRFLYLKQVLAELRLSPSSILDAGCGQGYIALYLAKRFPRAHITGLDLDQASVFEAELLRQASSVSNLTFKQHDSQEPLCQNEYDLVLSWEVLEYVVDDDAMLANLYAALRPGGVCLLHVVHSLGGYRRTGMRRKKSFDPTGWQENGMVRAGYLEEELEGKLRLAGFEHIVLKPTFGKVGLFAHSFFEVARKWPRPLYLISHLLLLIPAYVDVGMPKTYNGAILAMARKD
jgi:SAM-dependent methyltransferase